MKTLSCDRPALLEDIGDKGMFQTEWEKK